MIQTQFPLKKYTVMNNKSVQKLNCLDVYRYFCVSLTAIKGTTDITYEQIERLIGKKDKVSVSSYKSSSKQISFADKMNELEEVTVTKEYVKTPCKGLVKRNIYKIDYSTEGKTFRMPEKTLLFIDLDPKLKGYLLKLYSVCEIHTLLVCMTQKDLSELINVAPATIKKYNKELFDKGYLTDMGEGFKISIDGLNPLKNKKYQEMVDKYIETLEILLEVRSEEKGVQIYKKLKESNFEGIRDKLAILHYCVTGCKYISEKDKKQISDIIL